MNTMTVLLQHNIFHHLAQAGLGLHQVCALGLSMSHEHVILGELLAANIHI